MVVSEVDSGGRVSTVGMSSSNWTSCCNRTSLELGSITRIMEYDVDIQITKLVRGRELCKQMLSSQDPDEEFAMILTEQQEVRNSDPRNWMDDMKNFLLGNGYPQVLDKAKRRQYRLHTYNIIQTSEGGN
ncbi:hypothetical protein [Enterobacter hormaechei]|uniref:hypothetical protein n=1 Tax=Enterobacter hormaechei TaxID=158836 RepID=UPI0023E43437|nr:hypothetical protein [Enterobacter hormaechei]MDF3675358.1 hypothetical protein [Enterobacter hormaechei]